MVLQNYQNFIAMTSNMIYIVALVVVSNVRVKSIRTHSAPTGFSDLPTAQLYYWTLPDCLTDRHISFPAMKHVGRRLQLFTLSFELTAAKKKCRDIHFEVSFFSKQVLPMVIFTGQYRHSLIYAVNVGTHTQKRGIKNPVNRGYLIVLKGRKIGQNYKQQ